MLNITQIIAIAFIATFIVLLLKQYKPEYATFVSIIAGIIILVFVTNRITNIIELIETLIEDVGINKEFFKILLKITGIAYLIEFASNVCKDAGESAIASKVELAGKILIVAVSIPIISTLVQTITEVV